MKKLPYIIFALIFCIMPLTGCTDTSDSLFVIAQIKPWSNADLTHEKCEYDYEKLDKNGEAVATGKYVVEISVDKEVTTITSTLKVITEQGWTDQVISTVKCDSTTLSPHSVNKKINNFAYKDEAKTEVIDSKTKKSELKNRMFFSSDLYFSGQMLYFRQSLSSPKVMGETVPFLPIRLTAQSPSIP